MDEGEFRALVAPELNTFAGLLARNDLMALAKLVN